MTRILLHKLYSILLRNKWLTFASMYLLFFFIADICFADEYTEYCSYNKINEKYRTAGCWSCDVVGILMAGGVGAVNTMYPAMRDFSSALLKYGGAIWIVCFMLKTLGSFAAQDAGKVLDGLFLFMFKWMLAFTVVFGGLSIIIEWVVLPLLSIGFDIGTELSRLASIGGASSGTSSVSGGLFTGFRFEDLAREASSTENGPNDTLYALIMNIREIALSINEASSQMQKFGDLLHCAALHGKVAEWSVDAWIVEIKIGIIIAPLLWLASIVFIFIGFIISVAASFYMFDVAFNLCVSISLLPLAISLWPFGWTRSKLKEVVDSIVYYVGLFMFLPLGILVANTLVINVVTQIFGESMESLFASDNSDRLGVELGLISLGFLKVLLTYLIAFKIIPLFANEFCNHFFGAALLGNPISEKIQQAMQQVKKHTLGRLGKYTKDVAKHQLGKYIEKHGDHEGNFLQKTIAQYGSNMSKTDQNRR